MTSDKLWAILEDMAKKVTEKTIVMIDGANLHKGIEASHWHLDYKKFFVWLKEKYAPSTVLLFIGYIKDNQRIYDQLTEQGYKLIFKETVIDRSGKVKGNCDADLVLHAVSQYYEGKYQKLVLVTSDGDFASLVSFLLKRKAFRALISPSKHKYCSILLKKTNAPITYLEEIKNKVK